MSQQDKWNQRFAQANQPNLAVNVLTNNLHLLPQSGTALEIACGLGGNALLLAEQGLDVTAWDISDVALAKLNGFASGRGLSIHTQRKDVEANAQIEGHFDIIIVSRFLHRPLIAQLIDALTPGGLLMYQTFNTLRVDDSGPGNHYRLQPGELMTLCQDLEILYYREEGLSGDTTKGLRGETALVGRKSG